jgi:orotidine-5'-phosphate decarboxylase
MSKHFNEKLRAAAVRAQSLACVGLDPDINRFPESLKQLPRGKAIAAFNRSIIEATSDLVCAYKPNFAFYLQYGMDGLQALLETRKAIPSDIPVLLDCKVGDIDSTAAAYARGFFEEWGFDAITVNPYLGEDSLAPFFNYADRGVFSVCKTSNPGSGDLQDIEVAATGRPIFEEVAKKAVRWDETYPASVGLVVGATYPEQLALVRGIATDLPILLPGIGAQSGDIETSIRSGVDSAGYGLMASSSRGVTYASSGDDFADAARAAAISLRDATRNTLTPAL